MNLNPTSDYVLVIPTAPDTMTRGGIFIPEKYGKRTNGVGAVHAVGPEVTEGLLGKRVMYSRYAGTEIEVDDIKYQVMREDEIVIVLTP